MAGGMNILSWWAMAPDRGTREAWRQWATDTHFSAEYRGVLPACSHIPMMSLRRMSAGTRLAVESGLILLNDHQADMAIFTSRHGELERTHKILQHLHQEQPLSPTDFAMSVHNTAAGWLTITAKNTLPTTSLAAGEDSFQQGMIEAQAVLATGSAERVLLIDFDGIVPEVYQPFIPANPFPYAVALLLESGNSLNCRTVRPGLDLRKEPQSLSFLRGWLGADKEFTVPGPQHCWMWER
ncbi:beta-ketoacyl synthase chain length factor [Serratia plymuthica]|uniref:beta-ketoacyl synthase chain length factor n=1 Tax=Serratia TaxID=613 RepID=UPI0004561CAD|nr:beta-ketoacyl synthase chain length factor [Serratia plymuthica]AHY05804.1 beta-ketoacyl synthase [Serratia plymuthica]NIC27867.1 beta-ketoacyl synthase chain length factor [Serratia plymuthica]OJT37182.1 beta-ketoacyl synthase [Serratia plymuthica]UJE01870.1 beta-ketoacyl synthase chain length factor [Serratia plymuthica]